MSSFSNVTYMQHPRAYRPSHRALSPRHHLPSRVQPSPSTRPYPRDCASAQTSHRDSLFPTFYFSFTRMARSSARPHSSFNPYLPLRTRGERHPASHHRGSLLFVLPLRELAAEHGGIRLSALRPLRPHAAALSADAAPSAPQSPRRRRRSRRFSRPFEAVLLPFFLSRRIAAHIFAVWGAAPAPAGLPSPSPAFRGDPRYLRLPRRVFVALERRIDRRRRATRCWTDCCTARCARICCGGRSGLIGSRGQSQTAAARRRRSDRAARAGEAPERESARPAGRRAGSTFPRCSI